MDNQHANLGLFFQRGYYADLKIKDTLDKDSQKRYFDGKNSELLKLSKINIPERTDSPGIDSFRLETIYPGLITGIGMAHATGMEGEGKLGMAFDFTSGLPYIPGSSVKGLLRSVFPFPPKKKPKTQEEKEAAIKLMAEKRRFIKEILMEVKPENLSADETDALSETEIDDFAKDIFEDGKLKKQANLPSDHKDKNRYDAYDRDVFFDAQIEGDYQEKGILAMDFITPHKEALKNPTPIQFLKIQPKVKFVFRFKLSDYEMPSGKTISKNDKCQLFKAILKTVGIGAKTNVGYGQLKEVNEVCQRR